MLRKCVKVDLKTSLRIDSDPKEQLDSLPFVPLTSGGPCTII